MTTPVDVLDLALNTMKTTGPAGLLEMLAQVSKLLNAAPVTESDILKACAAPGHPLAQRLHQQIAKWDYLDAAAWTMATSKSTQARRSLIHDLLKSSAPLRAAFDKSYPPYVHDDSGLIAKEHKAWYTRDPNNDFYFSEYLRHLREAEGWSEESLLDLDATTTDVVSCLANPFDLAVYQSKGLVVGYVQSGKTANFTGVLAKAADAGYRLFIILGGMLDVLRDQTQRRVDKDLIGYEILKSNLEGHQYLTDREFETDFVRHGAMPSDLGYFDWTRLTGPGSDYEEKGTASTALGFAHPPGTGPLNSPANLRHQPAKLIVIKKNSTVLNRLVRDLGRLTMAQRKDIPALIIDDESDQASLDTTDPKKLMTGTERKAVHQAIRDLLGVLPRGQYVGYTATPFANVLTDSEDERNIFPEDFVLPLPKPKGYMGFRDFFDPTDPPEDATPADSNEACYVRPVSGEDSEPGNLPRAIDAFVLSGAIKLYRKSLNPKLKFKHHTMLVHRSARQKAHETDRAFVVDLLNKAQYRKSAGPGMARLKQLFLEDHALVSASRSNGETVPAAFDDLKPYVAECVSKLYQGKTVRIVNGDNTNKDEAPNFEEETVWAILVGGTKLSRGYTLEGLTVSYYRRSSGASDTLMQMGRWFGFRKGYQDLVRLYVGINEAVGKTRVNLLHRFREANRLEDRFRENLAIYALQRDPRITPLDLPPLVPYEMMLPTSRNKLHYAKLASENLGGMWKDPTYAPTEKEPAASKANDSLTRALLLDCSLKPVRLAAPHFQSKDGFDALVGATDPKRMMQFLRAFQWGEGGKGTFDRALGFLDGKMGHPSIDKWVVVAPRVVKPKQKWQCGAFALPIIERSRDGGDRYGVVTVPDHKKAAEAISMVRSGIGAKGLSADLQSLVGEKTATMLVYVVQDAQEKQHSICMALVFPTNGIARRVKVLQSKATSKA